MILPFIKMHAQGNDFIILDAFAHNFPNIDFSDLAKDICTYRFGIGADGLVLIRPVTDFDGQMTIYNSDGSLALMCGSALRCVSYLLSQKLNKSTLKVLTESGVKTCNVNSNANEVVVNLGKAELISNNVQLGQSNGYQVNIGNNHLVYFMNEINRNKLIEYQMYLSERKDLPRGLNLEIVQLISATEIRMMVYEHGVGETLACGTGSAASVYAGIVAGLLSDKVSVSTSGGNVHISYNHDTGELTLSGRVEYVFNGEYLWKH